MRAGGPGRWRHDLGWRFYRTAFTIPAEGGIVDSSVEDRISSALEARKAVTEGLLSVLEPVLRHGESLSETQFHDRWVTELKSDGTVLPSGWYTPPPQGFAVLFGSGQNFSRTNFQSLRPETSWPQADRMLDLEDGLISLYASPVHATTGMIG